MNYKIRKGTDVVLHIDIEGNTNHVFGEIKFLTVCIANNHKSENKHIPTETATNQCCNDSTTTYQLELKSLITSSDSSTVLVDSLIPADIQRVGRVYCFIITIVEKTDDLISDDNIYQYKIDLEDTVQFVDHIDDATLIGNEINTAFHFGELATK